MPMSLNEKKRQLKIAKYDVRYNENKKHTCESKWCNRANIGLRN